MKILIPPSEGKAKIQRPQDIQFKDTNFVYERYVKQVVRLLNLIDNEDLKSIYGTSQEKAEGFLRQNEDITDINFHRVDVAVNNPKNNNSELYKEFKEIPF